MDDPNPNALQARLTEKLMDVAYVRTPEGHEVDFIARRPGWGEELIQVAAEATDAATAERELRALAEAGRLYPKGHKTLADAHPRWSACPGP